MVQYIHLLILALLSLNKDKYSEIVQIGSSSFNMKLPLSHF